MGTSHHGPTVDTVVLKLARVCGLGLPAGEREPDSLAGEIGLPIGELIGELPLLLLPLRNDDALVVILIGRSPVLSVFSGVAPRHTGRRSPPPDSGLDGDEDPSVLFDFIPQSRVSLSF